MLMINPGDFRAEGMQANVVDVIVVSDKDLCLELRKSGYDEPMILYSDLGLYLDKKYSDLVNLVLDAPITMSATLDLKKWFKRVADRDQTVLRWNSRTQATDEIKLPLTSPTKRENSSPPLKESLREICMHCAQIVCVPMRAINTAVYVINKIIRAFIETAYGHVTGNDELQVPNDYASKIDVDNRTFTAHHVYHKPYVVAASSPADDVKIRPILSARFAFIEGSEWWAGGTLAEDKTSARLNLSLIKTVFQRLNPTTLALKFNDSAIHNSYLKWMGDGEYRSDMLRNIGGVMLTFTVTLYLMAVIIVSDDFSIIHIFLIGVLIVMVSYRRALLSWIRRCFGIRIETFTWPLILCFMLDFYHAGLVLIYISGTGRYLPSILCELASRENIHALIRYRYTNYMLIVFMYFLAMRFALPNPTSAFFWFGVFIYVRAILASKNYFRRNAPRRIDRRQKHSR